MVTDRPLTDSLTALLYYRFQVLCSHVGGNIIIIVLEHLFCQCSKKEVSQERDRKKFDFVTSTNYRFCSDIVYYNLNKQMLKDVKYIFLVKCVHYLGY